MTISFEHKDRRKPDLSNDAKKNPAAGKANKKYLQACDISGSIYGKTRSTDNRPGRQDKPSEKDDNITSYNSLYKRQVAILNKIIRREK